MPSSTTKHLGQIDGRLRKIEISSAKIEEHLRNQNGAIGRAFKEIEKYKKEMNGRMEDCEDGLENCNTEIGRLKVSYFKILTIAGVGGAFGATLTTIVLFVLKFFLPMIG